MRYFASRFLVIDRSSILNNIRVYSILTLLNIEDKWSWLRSSDRSNDFVNSVEIKFIKFWLGQVSGWDIVFFYLLDALQNWRDAFQNPSRLSYVIWWVVLNLVDNFVWLWGASVGIECKYLLGAFLIFLIFLGFDLTRLWPKMSTHRMPTNTNYKNFPCIIILNIINRIYWGNWRYYQICTSIFLLEVVICIEDLHD